jgi:hypothetical protein
MALFNQLVGSLKTQFPGVSFRGGASYEREVIYISVRQIDDATFAEIERWLRATKSEQKVEPEIWLQFESDDTEKEKKIEI